MYLFEDVGVVLLMVAALESSRRLLSPEPAQRPGDMSADQWIGFMSKAISQHGHSATVTSVSKDHRGVAKQPSALGALKR